MCIFQCGIFTSQSLRNQVKLSEYLGMLRKSRYLVVSQSLRNQVKLSELY